jgi:hypothetical protein
MDVGNQATAIDRLANAVAKLVNLERTVHGISDEGNKGDSNDNLTDEQIDRRIAELMQGYAGQQQG